MMGARHIRNSLFGGIAISIVLLAGAPKSVAAADEKASENTGKDPYRIYIDAGASTAQISKIKEMAGAVETENIRRSHEMLTLIQDIRALSLQPELDEKKLLEDQRQLNELQAQMSTERTRLLIRIRKVLSPEQRQKLVTLMDSERHAVSQR